MNYNMFKYPRNMSIYSKISLQSSLYKEGKENGVL